MVNFSVGFLWVPVVRITVHSRFSYVEFPYVESARIFQVSLESPPRPGFDRLLAGPKVAIPEVDAPFSKLGLSRAICFLFRRDIWSIR